MITEKQYLKAKQIIEQYEKEIILKENYGKWREEDNKRLDDFITEKFFNKKNDDKESNRD